MKSLLASAAVATLLLSGCASYDYGYNGYAYSYPGYYDSGYAYYGPSYYSYPYYPYYYGYGGPVISGGVVISGRSHHDHDGHWSDGNRDFRGTRSSSSNQTFNNTRVVNNGNRTVISGSGSRVTRSRGAESRVAHNPNGRFVEREKAG